MDAAICANLIELAVPATLPGQPSNATSRLDAFRGFANTAEVYEFLREGGCLSHDAERAGIASLDEWEAERLHPGLMGAGRIWMPLRSLTGDVYNILTDEGCIRPHVSELSELLRDATIAKGLETTKRLYAVPSVLDAALYRAAGLAAIPYRVLDGISIDDLKAGLQIMHDAMWGTERAAARAPAAALDNREVAEPAATKQPATKSATTKPLANQPAAGTDVHTNYVGDEALLGIASDDLPLPAQDPEYPAFPVTLPLVAPANAGMEGPSPAEHAPPLFKSDQEAAEYGLGPGVLAFFKPEIPLQAPSRSDDPDDGYRFDYFADDYAGAQRDYDTGHWLFVIDGSATAGKTSELPACQSLLAHLVTLCHLRLEPDRIRIWRLGPDDLAGILACTCLGSGDALMRYILDRTAANLEPLVEPKRPPVVPLGEAALALYRSLDASSSSPSAISEARRRYMTSVEVNILEPVLARIDPRARPAESLKMVQLAHLIRQYFDRQVQKMCRPVDRPEDAKQATEALKRERQELLLDGELQQQIQILLEDDECKTRTGTRPVGYWSTQIRRLAR